MVKKTFGSTKEGISTFTYEIANTKGMKAVVTDYGATIVSIFVPDTDGIFRDVVLGHDSVSEYEHDSCYFGATVGPSAGRIGNAVCCIDGKVYHLEQNNNENNLHSGSKGVSWKVWDVRAWNDNSITFRCTSENLEQGFPGNTSMEVTFTVTEDDGLKIDYKAVSDQKTTFNMTNHTYFNLSGHDSGDIYDQMLQVNASAYTPLRDSKAIPTGVIAPVEGTPMDFRTPKKIGDDIGADFDQLIYGAGYDHNWVLDKRGEQPERALTAWSVSSGIQLDILTDLPGIQIYTGNFVIDEPGKNGAVYQKRSGFAAETQCHPNSINEAAFPNVIYDAGQVYRTTTIFRFSVRK